MATPQRLAQTLQLQGYAPPVQASIKRSQYLEDALKDLNASSTKIQSGKELGARLLANAVLNYGQKKNDRSLAEGLASERERQSKDALSWIGADQPVVPPVEAPAAAPSVQEPRPTTEPIQQTPLPPLPVAATPAPKRVPLSSKGLAEAIYGLIPGARMTSGARTPEKNASVNGVANSYHLKDQAADFVPPPGVPMTQLASLARNKFGPGYDVLNEGNHVHIEPGPSFGAQGQADAPQAPPMQYAQAPAPMAQSMPQQSPPPMQAPPQQPQRNPLMATPQEITIVQGLLSNPQTHAQGIAKAREIQMRAAAPQKNEFITQNGVVSRVSPYGDSAPNALPIPQAAMNQVGGAQQFGVQAPQGTQFQRDPYGKLSPVYEPPAGYGLMPDGSFGAIKGSDKDIYKPQAPQPGFQYDGHGRQSPIQGSGQDPSGRSNIVQNELALRKEYEANPVIQNYLTARAGFEKVVSGAKANSAAGDMAGIFGFMKSMDPGSTVREGEYASAENARGIPEGLRNLYNRAKDGVRLTPAQRLDFVNTAFGQLQAYEGPAMDRAKQFTSMADSYGFNPGRIVQPFTPVVNPFAQPAAPKGAVDPGALAEARKRGLIK